MSVPFCVIEFENAARGDARAARSRRRHRPRLRVLQQVMRMGSTAAQPPATLARATHRPLDDRLARRACPGDVLLQHAAVSARSREGSGWAVLSGSNTWASAVKKLADFASLYRLATVQPLDSGSKGLWIGRSHKRTIVAVVGQREYTVLLQ